MAETPLLDDVVVRSSVDFKGLPAVRSKSGGWKSATLIIGVEMAEVFAYYGIKSNLVSYLTGPLAQSTATAAANVNAWSGVTSFSPLLCSVFADSYLGRNRTIIVTTLLNILGLGFLSLSTALHSSNYSDCQSDVDNMACSPPQVQIIFFFFSLYLVALAQGNKPCLQAFGADQFDEEDEKECKAKGSFFNWWSFGVALSILVGLWVLSYIQENLSWELGFGIPCIVMCFALIVFLIGSMTYRFPIRNGERNPFVRIGRVFVRAARNWRIAPSIISIDEEARQILPYEDVHSSRFLDKATLEPNGPKDIVCSVGDIEDAKSILRLLPISFTCLPYAIVSSQTSTLFNKQGVTMDRYITTNFQIPAAALQSLSFASTVLFIPLYDRVLVPIARAITKRPLGISMLQRIGTGIFLCTIAMLIAGCIERKRLATAFEYGLVDSPNATVPMSVWWIAPQYLVLGIADVLTLIGLQEFFYDQVPSDFKSMGLALFYCIIGSGSFLSSFLISMIEKATSGRGRESWFANNLNRAHLDYFYWLLAGLVAFSLVFYVNFAKSYAYNGRICCLKLYSITCHGNK
ncbi:hypothetical protein DH2020_036651 [Rehmannia glutinosa]|uniref:Protein NRT1/ PTR FAMILY 5.10-like n=1 Tax=Rehmannia glutinosa TaxID=99300 RepID=A0ABR0V3Z3_REHGL